MRMYNTSLDEFDCQCDGKVFKFYARKATEVPNDLVTFIYERYRESGVFAIDPNDTPEQSKAKARAALTAYLHGKLRDRIMNHMAMQDEYKKKGVTLEKSPLFERALRWDKEIRTLLQIEAPIETELSFLDESTRKKLGMSTEGLEHVDQQIFDVTKVLAAQKEAKEAEDAITQELEQKAQVQEEHKKEQMEAVEDALSGKAAVEEVEHKRGRGRPRKDAQSSAEA